MTTPNKRTPFPILVLLLLASALLSACGVKGPPLPPIGKTTANPRPSSLPSLSPQ